MAGNWFVRLTQAAVITVTLAAVCQELEKPEEQRTWHGKVGFIPYDFRFPNLRRFKKTYWNPTDERLFTPEPWGIGWGINFYTLCNNLRLFREATLSEEDFLMPTQSHKKVLEHRPAAQ